jgi:hypothetical protein
MLQNEVTADGSGIINRSRVHGRIRCRKNGILLRSILYDLDIPQQAASLIYEDNDGATAMANAQKPTTRRDIWILNILLYLIGWKWI